MDARGGTSAKAEPKGKPDDKTKGKPKDSDRPTKKKAAAASGQQKPKSNDSFSMAGSAVVAPAFKAAHQDVKAQHSGSANPPLTVPSKSSQVNPSDVKRTPPSFMTTAQPLTFGWPSPDIGSSFGFTFDANPPIANGPVNQSAVGHASASPMAMPSPFQFGGARPDTERLVGFTFGANPPIADSQGNRSAVGHAPMASPMATPSPFIFGRAPTGTARFVGFGFGGNPSITGRQANQAEVVRPPTLPSENGLPSVFANGYSDVPGFDFAGSQGDTVQAIPTEANGPVKIIVEAERWCLAEVQKAADNGKKKTGKRSKKKERAAKLSKRARDDQYS